MKNQQSENSLFDFEKLQVYQLALDLLDQIVTICRRMPKDLQYAVSDQMIRACLSISNNLAEGAGKRFKKEKARYYGTAIDSARECVSMLNVLERQRCLSSEEYIELRNRTRRITAMLSSLIRSLDRDLKLESSTGKLVHRSTSTQEC